MLRCSLRRLCSGRLDRGTGGADADAVGDGGTVRERNDGVVAGENTEREESAMRRQPELGLGRGVARGCHVKYVPCKNSIDSYVILHYGNHSLSEILNEPRSSLTQQKL